VTPELARELIEQTLLDIVPDADLSALPPDAEIREYLELDSLDFMVLVERLSKRAGCRIDEEDYGELRTMDSTIRFLVARSDA
jgi:acyl carrier protein